MRRERDRIEAPVAARALRELLVPSIKLIADNQAGIPDRLFLVPGGRPLFIEMKWPGQEPAPVQLYWHTLLRNLGYQVEVHDNVTEALCAIARSVVAATVYAAGREVPTGTRGRAASIRSRLAENKHYTRSVQFLAEAGRSSTDAGDSAA